MTQETVANAIGAERVEISRWELGKAYPSEKQIEKLCELFAVPREFLVGEKPEQLGDWDQNRLFVAEISGNFRCMDGGVEAFVKAEDGSVLYIDRENYVIYEEMLQGYETLYINPDWVQKVESQEFPVRTEAKKLTGGIRCSFCGKPQNLCDHIIAGNNSYICDECVKICTEVLQDERYKKDE